jgi:predicted TIM-barrel enzyme
VFDTDQAADLAKAGADVLVPHMGTIGTQTIITLQDAALSVQGMHDAVKKVNRTVVRRTPTSRQRSAYVGAG